MSLPKTTTLESNRTSKGYKLTFVFTEKAHIVSETASLCEYSLRISTNGYTYGQYGTGYAVTVNGDPIAHWDRTATPTNYTSCLEREPAYTEIAHGEFRIQHEQDGTLVHAPVGCTIDISSAGTAPGAMNLSGYVDFEPIALEPSTLNAVSDWYCVDTDGSSKMSFGFTPVAAADHHGITVTVDDLTVVSSDDYTSGQALTLTTTNLRKLYKRIGDGGAMKRQAVVTLTTYDSSNGVVGTDSKTFYVKGCGIDIKKGGAWRNGMLWKNIGGTWRCGIVWVNVDGVWKKGVRL